MKVSFNNLIEGNRLLVILCSVAIIANIIVAAIFSGNRENTATITACSNIVTVILMTLIYRPLKGMLKNKANQDLNNELKREDFLFTQRNQLETDYKELKINYEKIQKENEYLDQELFWIKSLAGMNEDALPDMKTETIIVEKAQNILREEIVRENEYGKDIDKNSKLNPFGKDKGEQKVLFAKNYHGKTKIGINITQISFLRKDDKIYLEGVNFVNTDANATYPDDETNINRCLIVNTENNEILSINDSSKYDDFKNWYRKAMDERFLNSFRSDIMDACTAYTTALKETLKDRFQNIEFVDSCFANRSDLKGYEIFPIKKSHDADIVQLTYCIQMITNAFTKVMENKQKLNSTQSGRISIEL